jgi:uncharacterized protein YcnI
MASTRRLVWRVLTAAGALYLASTAAMTTAAAHVQASSTDAVRGGVAVVTFQVPNESTIGSATTALTIDVSNVSAVQAESAPGWAAKLDRDPASGKVASVTWTAAPNGGIPVDEFGVFRISAKLPDADTVAFPAAQTYADGAVVKWDQPSAPGAPEPEHPAPTLTLTALQTPPTQPVAPTTSAAPTATAAPPQQPSSSVDNTARVLAGVALLIGAVGIGVTLITRRT